MREIDIDIKFRFWDKKQKLMNPVGMIDFDNHQVFSLTWVEYLDYVLMQYTGLKDKNGKEIYEGDILKDIWGNIEKVNHIISWEGDGHPMSGFVFDYESIGFDRADTLNCEVIGNIYEHPELLEGKNSGE